MTIRTVLENELVGIRDDLLRLGSLVDQAIDRSLKALNKRDVALAQQVVDEDQTINDLRYKIEKSCMRVFATQQPMASDLRTIIAAMNIANELERMGDHAKGISKTLVNEGADAVGNLVIDLPQMADVCHEMLRKTMDALLEGKVKKARKVAASDDRLDEMYKQIFGDLINQIAQDKVTVSRGIYQLWAAHNLERIGDRVTNICEQVVFISTGKLRDLNPDDLGTA